MADPTPNNRKLSDSQNASDEVMDVRDLVSKGGYDKDPREIVENPAVTPEMYEESKDSQTGFQSEESA